MVHVIKPQKVRVETHKGEVSLEITLNLNIDLTSSGLSVQANATATEVPNTKKVEEEDEGGKPLVPDFTSERIKFGKRT